MAPIDPKVLSSIIGGGASLLGNLFGYSSTKSTNKANYQIAQMNNKYNYLMMLKQMEYNQNMWKKQNEYNSPSAQMARLREAGINPYMALGMMSSGQAQSAGGVNPPTAQGAHMEAFQPDFSGIGIAAQQYIVNKQNESLNRAAIAEKESIANYNNQQAEYYGAKAVSEMAELWSRTRDNRAKAIYQETLNNHADDMFSSDVKYKQELAATQEVNKRIALMQESAERLRLENLPKELKAELDVVLSQTALLRSQGKLTDRQATHEVQKQIETVQRASKFRLDNKLIMSTFDELVKSARLQNAAISTKTGSEWFSGTLGNVIGLGVGYGLSRIPGARTVIKGFGK